MPHPANIDTRQTAPPDTGAAASRHQLDPPLGTVDRPGRSFLATLSLFTLGLVFSAALSVFATRALLSFQVLFAYQHTTLLQSFVSVLGLAIWLLTGRYGATSAPAGFYRLAKSLGWIALLSLAAILIMPPDGAGIAESLLLGILLIDWVLIALAVPVGVRLASQHREQGSRLLLHVLFLTAVMFVPSLLFVSAGPL